MKMLVIKKGGFSVTELTGVTNIAYSSGTVTITHAGGTSTYTYADYMLQFIV